MTGAVEPTKRGETSLAVIAISLVFGLAHRRECRAVELLTWHALILGQHGPGRARAVVFREFATRCLSPFEFAGRRVVHLVPLLAVARCGAVRASKPHRCRELVPGASFAPLCAHEVGNGEEEIE